MTARKRPPTRAQIIKGMKDYLKHQDDWTSAQLKGKSNKEIERLYYIAYRKVQKFVPIDQEDEERTTKKAKDF